MVYKTFADLEFLPHDRMPGLRAKMQFENSYGVSVVRFKMLMAIPGGHEYGSYTDNEQEWEVAVTHNGEVTYGTPITDDVIGHQSESDVTDIMKRVQDLKKDAWGVN